MTDPFINLLSDDLTSAAVPSSGHLASPASARRFIEAGKAIFTLKSRATGMRFTYRVTQAPDNATVYFVGVLSGPDNASDYRYLGYIRRDVYFHGGRKARIDANAPSAKAFDWAWRHIVQDAIPAQLEIWHEGRCARCARVLTVPESIASGFGPECIQHVRATPEAAFSCLGL